MSRRLSLPLRRTPVGRLATIPHDGPQAVAEAVALLLDTRPGERRSIPEYGLHSGLFGSGVDATQLVAVAQQWHPEADPLAVSVALAGSTQTVVVQPGVDDEAFV